MIYFDLLQGSEEWHAMRYGKISGSLSKSLFVDSDTLFISLLSCRMESFKLEPPGYESDAMIRGKELEPFARMEISRKAKLHFKQAGWIQNDNISLLGISPDGITECGTIAAEFKCPSREVHMETLLTNDIPLKNIHQCLHYFTVNEKLKELHFGSFRPECKIRLFHKVLTPESIINIGTKAKPVLDTIGELSKQCREKAQNIEQQIKNSLIKLKL